MKYLIWFLGLLGSSVYAQEALQIAPSELMHTHWQFAYASKVDNNLVLNQADSSNQLVWYFGFENEVRIFQNGTESLSNWSLNKGILNVEFGDLHTWRVSRLDAQALVLSYLSPSDSAWYAYHFKRLEEDQSPIVLGLAWLPTLEINHTLADAKPRYPHRFVRNEKGKRGLGKPSTRAPKEEPIFIQIEMVGGGYFGGPDPIYRNSLVIKTDGTVLRQIRTELQGLREYRHQISRKSLEELLAYIEKRDFFELDQGYNCRTEDCLKRMKETPRPVAFRLAITHGERRKVVAVSIWEGPKGLRWVDYPESLNEIVQAIERLTVY